MNEKLKLESTDDYVYVRERETEVISYQRKKYEAKCKQADIWTKDFNQNVGNLTNKRCTHFTKDDYPNQNHNVHVSSEVSK